MIGKVEIYSLKFTESITTLHVPFDPKYLDSMIVSFVVEKLLTYNGLSPLDY